MKNVLATLFAAGLAACAFSPGDLNPKLVSAGREQRAFDMWTVDSIQQAAIDCALLEQRAIYPYDFLPDSAALTDLAKRDLALLADGYRASPGRLVLVRGDASETLYTQRREALLTALQQAGVAGGRVDVVEGRPGGEGLTGQSILDARRSAQRSNGGSNSDGDSMTYSDRSISQP